MTPKPKPKYRTFAQMILDRVLEPTPAAKRRQAESDANDK
jgi:hypothetical protein